jgi:hypothetical protein
MPTKEEVARRRESCLQFHGRCYHKRMATVSSLGIGMRLVRILTDGMGRANLPSGFPCGNVRTPFDHLVSCLLPAEPAARARVVRVRGRSESERFRPKVSSRGRTTPALLRRPPTVGFEGRDRFFQRRVVSLLGGGLRPQTRRYVGPKCAGSSAGTRLSRLRRSRSRASTSSSFRRCLWVCSGPAAYELRRKSSASRNKTGPHLHRPRSGSEKMLGDRGKHPTPPQPVAWASAASRVRRTGPP